MQEESMWNLTSLSKELIQKFMDESRWIFGEKEKDFLVATPRNFSNNKRINPKRFRHLDGRSRLHQGFLCFSYKQRALQYNSSPPSTREKYHSIPPMFQLHHHQKFSVTTLQCMGFQDFMEKEKASTPSPPSIFRHHHLHHQLVFTTWVTCGRGFKVLWLQDLHLSHMVFSFYPLNIFLFVA